MKKPDMSDTQFVGCQVGNVFKRKFCSWQSASENDETSSRWLQLWLRFCWLHWYVDRWDFLTGLSGRNRPNSNNTESAVEGNKIVGARVGKIESFPWEEKPMPDVLKPGEQLLAELMPESNYTDFGMKKNDKIYRSMLLSTKSLFAGKVSYENCSWE